MPLLPLHLPLRTVSSQMQEGLGLVGSACMECMTIAREGDFLGAPSPADPVLSNAAMKDVQVHCCSGRRQATLLTAALLSSALLASYFTSECRGGKELKMLQPLPTSASSASVVPAPTEQAAAGAQAAPSFLLEYGSMDKLASGRLSCVGSGKDTACAATWACLSPSEPLKLYARGVSEPAKVLLRPIWMQEFEHRATLTVLPWQEGISAIAGGNASAPAVLVHGTTILALRYAAGNFGHVLLENLIPIVKLGILLERNFTLRGMRAVLLDDCADRSDFELMWGYSPSPAGCGRFTQLARLLEPTALVATLADVFGPGAAAAAMPVCFERALFGVGSRSGLVWGAPDARENAPADQAPAIELMYRHWEAQLPAFLPPPPPPSPAPGARPPLRAVVHAKARTNRHGAAILNGRELCAALRNVTAECAVISMDNITEMEDQVRAVAAADVYVSDSGSSMYYAFFMRRGALHLTYSRSKPLRVADACQGRYEGNISPDPLLHLHDVVRTFTQVTSLEVGVPPDAAAVSFYNPPGPPDPNGPCPPGGKRPRWPRWYDYNAPLQATVDAVVRHVADARALAQARGEA